MNEIVPEVSDLDREYERDGSVFDPESPPFLAIFPTWSSSFLIAILPLAVVFIGPSSLVGDGYRHYISN